MTGSKKILLLFLLLISTKTFAQESKSKIGCWGMLLNQTRFHNKWSLHSEIQFRAYDLKANTEQLLVRAGINFHQSFNTTFTAGYGWITNYNDDGEIFKTKISNENRIWEQLLLKDKRGRIFLEHRYRFEQRWIESVGHTNYRNRIRYLLRATIPINRKELIKNTLFLSVYDEVFINITKTPFDRNRLYGAIGYQLNASTNIQIGYLLQTLSTFQKQYLQFGINYNPDLRTKVK